MKETQRIDKILANLGFGSRKEIKQILKEGLVTVDGEIVSNNGLHINPYQQDIRIKGKKVYYNPFVYLMMNKPAGYISATFDKRMDTIIELVPEEYRHYKLFPVGRLDRDTEGLLFLTNDGQFAHQLLSPKKHVPKKYYVILEGIINEHDINIFSQGMILEDGYRTLPGELHIIKSADRSEVELTIYEGKFHQVKRMFAVLDKKVIYLKRIAMGEIELDPHLEKGKCRPLTDQELSRLNHID